MAQPSLTDELLFDIAARIQLPPSLYERAKGRYAAIAEYLERDGSPLKDYVRNIYPQGSMAINSTIRSKDEDDLFDIDLVVEIDAPYEWSPDDLLQVLWRSIQGDPSSRYYEKVKRQTRCVTIKYAEMHLDLTPLRPFEIPQFAGEIAHANPDKIHEQHYKPAAPKLLADWYLDSVPKPADDLRKRLVESAAIYDRFVEKAETAPVPDQQDVFAKSITTVALQLLKRFIQIQYDRRSCRRPPSVALSVLVATDSLPTNSPLRELRRQAEVIALKLQAALHQQVVIEVVNPPYPADLLTDRWPQSVEEDQKRLLDDLLELIRCLEALEGEVPLKTIQSILARLFGERTTADAVNERVTRVGRAIDHGALGVVVGSGALTGSQAGQGIIVPPKRRFYGGEFK